MLEFGLPLQILRKSMYISSLDEIMHLLTIYLSSTKPLLLFYFYSKVVTIIPTLGMKCSQPGNKTFPPWE